MFLLAIAFAIIVGGIGYKVAAENRAGTLVRVAAMVAGAIIGYWLTYYLASKA